MICADKKEKFKRVLLSVFILAFMLISVPPVRLWELDVYSRLDGYLRVYLFSDVLIIYIINAITKGKIEPVVFLCGAYCIIWISSTFLNGGSLKEAVWSDTVTPMAIVCAIDLFTEKHTKETLQVLFYVYGAIVLINAVTVLLYLQNAQSLVEIGDYAFLGNRNSHIFYYLIFLLCGFYGVRKGYLPNRSVYLLGYIVCLITAIMTKGLTTLVVLIVWGVFLLFSFVSGFRHKLSFTIVFLIILVSFVSIQAYDGENIRVFSRILEMLDKNAYMSSRVPVWKISREWIRKSPVFGYGAVDYVKMVANAHPHNLFLAIVFRCGAIGGTIMLLMYFYLGRLVKKMRSTDISMGLTVFVLCLMVESLFDMIDIPYYYLYIALLFSFCRNELRVEA